MRRIAECLLCLALICIAAGATVWFPWLALCGAAGLAAGFIFGNLYHARMDSRRSGVLGIEVVRLRNFKSSIQALCDKLK